MKQPYVSTLISQNFTSAEKALARYNIEAISSADLDGYVKSEDLEEYVTSGDLSSYATTEYVDQSVSGFITSADLPDMTDVATKSWVSDQNYLTSVPSQYVTEDELTSAVSGKADRSEIPDVSDFTTHSEVDAAIQSATSGKMDQSESANFYPRYSNPEGYLTSIPYQYVTDTEMRSYVADHTSAFLTSADIPPIPEDVVTSGELANVSADIVSQIPSLDGYATEQYVQDYTSAFITSADLPDVSDMATMTWVNEQHYITSADVPAQVEYSAGSNIEITDHVISVDGTSQIIPGDNVSITASGDDYVISAQVPETSAFVTEQEMNDSIQSATSAFLTSADITPQQQADWTEADSGAVDYIKNKPTIIGIEQGRGISISTSSASMVISTSDEYVNSAFVLNSIQSATSGFITSGDVPAQVQSDWTQADSTSVDYIKNKPFIPEDKVYVFNSNSFNRGAVKTAFDAGKLVYCNTTIPPDYNKVVRLQLAGYDDTTIDGVGYEVYWFSGSVPKYDATSEQYGEAQFNIPAEFFYYNKSTREVTRSGTTAWQLRQADWNQSDNTADDYIKNKPFTGSLEAESPLYFTDETSGSTIHIESSAIVPSGRGSDQYLALEYGEPTWKECTRNVYYADIPSLTTITSSDIANGYKDIPINMFSGENKGARNFIWSMDIKEANLVHGSSYSSLVGVVEKIKTSTFYQSNWYDYTNGSVADPYGVLFDNILESDLTKVPSQPYLAKPIHMIGGTGGAIATYGASLRIVFKTPLAVVENDQISFMGRIYAVRCDAQW